MAATNVLRAALRSLTQPRRGKAVISDALSVLRPQQLRWMAGSASQAAASRCSCAAEAEALPPTFPAEPGTVAPHTHHVFLRLPAPRGFQSSEPDFEAWWPPLVEKEPGVVKAFTAVAAAMKEQPSRVGGVKVSAVIEVESSGASNTGHDVILFPTGVEYLNVPLDRIEALVTHHLRSDDEGEHGASREPPPGLPCPLELQGSMCLFVCCHGARDTRCGAHGPPLAAALTREIQALEREGTVPEGAMRVFQCSHIGGHKYAGNVLVHGSISACDGDWFGGVKATDAKKFVRNLVYDPGCEGGHDHPGMRQWWRGCMGLSKEEQVQAYVSPPTTLDLDDLSDDDGSGSEDDEMEEMEMEMEAGEGRGHEQHMHELDAKEMAQFDELVREMGIDGDARGQSQGRGVAGSEDEATEAEESYAQVMRVVMPGLSMEEVETRLEGMNEEEFAGFFEKFNAVLDQHVSGMQEGGEVEGPTLPYGDADTRK